MHLSALLFQVLNIGKLICKKDVLHIWQCVKLTSIDSYRIDEVCDFYAGALRRRKKPTAEQM